MNSIPIRSRNMSQNWMDESAKIFFLLFFKKHKEKFRIFSVGFDLSSSSTLTHWNGIKATIPSETWSFKEEIDAISKIGPLCQFQTKLLSRYRRTNDSRQNLDKRKNLIKWTDKNYSNLFSFPSLKKRKEFIGWSSLASIKGNTLNNFVRTVNSLHKKSIDLGNRKKMFHQLFSRTFYLNFSRTFSKWNFLLLALNSFAPLIFQISKSMKCFPAVTLLNKFRNVFLISKEIWMKSRLRIASFSWALRSPSKNRSQSVTKIIFCVEFVKYSTKLADCCPRISRWTWLDWNVRIESSILSMKFSTKLWLEQNLDVFSCFQIFRLFDRRSTFSENFIRSPKPTHKPIKILIETKRSSKQNRFDSSSMNLRRSMSKFEPFVLRRFEHFEKVFNRFYSRAWKFIDLPKKTERDLQKNKELSIIGRQMIECFENVFFFPDWSKRNDQICMSWWKLTKSLPFWSMNAVLGLVWFIDEWETVLHVLDDESILLSMILYAYFNIVLLLIFVTPFQSVSISFFDWKKKQQEKDVRLK